MKGVRVDFKIASKVNSYRFVSIAPDNSPLLPAFTEMSFKTIEIATKPFEGQKPGTSGLRKRLVD